MIKKELHEILACPICKMQIRFDEAKNALICDNCKKQYPIRDDIPIMLPEEATDINEC